MSPPRPPHPLQQEGQLGFKISRISVPLSAAERDPHVMVASRLTKSSWHGQSLALPACLSDRTIPNHTIPYDTIPFDTIPYHTIPYHIIPYHTISYYTIPWTELCLPACQPIHTPWPTCEKLVTAQRPHKGLLMTAYIYIYLILRLRTFTITCT